MDKPSAREEEKRFKIYRREEWRVKSRGERGISKPDSLEMLPQRGGQHLLVFPSLETQETEGQTERGKGKKIPDSKPKANLKSKNHPSKPKLDSLAVRHCPSQLLLAGINGSTPPREDTCVAFPGPPWAPIPQLMCHG